MITHTFTHLKKSLVLCFFLLMFASNNFIEAQSVSYECSCDEANPAGLLSFVINTWGCDPSDVITLQNGTNLLDSDGNPLPDGTEFSFVIGTTFTLRGLSDPAGPVPLVTIFKNGEVLFPEYEMFSCRAPSFPILPANPSVCAGGLVTLSMVDEDGNPPPSDVTWTTTGADEIDMVSPVVSGESNNTLQVSYCNPGTYTVTATGTADGCDYSFSNTITVTNPSAGASITGASEFYLCGAPIEEEYTVMPIADGLDIGFKVIGADGMQIGNVMPGSTTGSGTGSGTVSFTGLAAGEYMLQLCNLDTEIGACKLGEVTAPISILDGPPTISLPEDMTLDHLCTGQEYELVATVTPTDAQSISFFQFDCTDASVTPVLLSDSGQSVTITQSGCYRAVIAEGQAECTAQDEIMVTYGNGVSVEVMDMTLCSGEMLPATNPGPWPLPLTWFAQGSTIPVTTPLVSGIYTAVIANGLSCEESESVFITVIQSPTVDLPDHTIRECAGVNVAINAGPAGEFNYAWSHDATEASSTVVFTTSGMYCVTVTTTDGLCSASDCVVIEFMEEPTVGFAEDSATFCGSGCIDAIVEGTTTVAWFFNGELVVGETSTQLCVTESGAYTAVVGENLTCEESATIDVSIIDMMPEIQGMSCVCLNSINTYNLVNFNSVDETFTVCNEDGSSAAATSFNIFPASGSSDLVDIEFLVPGNFLVKATGTSSGPEACSIASSLPVIVLEEDNSSLACNSLVNVTLNNNCELELLPEMILEGQTAPNEAYTVTISDANGNIIDGMLTQDLIGQTLNVTITQKCGNNSCWGEVLVEDKSIEPLGQFCTGGPFLSTCFEVDVPGDMTGFPMFEDDVVATYRPATNDWFLQGYDNCSDVVLTFVDDNTSAQCASPQSVRRTWTVTDINNGAQSSCSVNLEVSLVDLNSIVWPKNFDSVLDADAEGAADTDGVCPSIELCSGFPTDARGNPDPSFTGFPSGLVCTNLEVIGYSDRVIPVCGETMKIVRTWTVWDACAQESATHNQTIVLTDTTSPICSAPANGSVSTSTHDCGATLTVGPPSVQECQTWTYTIEYRVEGSNAFVSTGATFDPATNNYTISDLDFEGSSVMIRYTVTDVCGNRSETDCISEISLRDTEQPIPACDLFNTITLNQFGTAFAGPSTFDDNSWDNCGIYEIVIQRMDTQDSECDCEERDFEFMSFLGAYTNDHYYYISNEPVSSENATAYAAALGGALASGDSTAEADWIAEQVGLVTSDPVHMAGTSLSNAARYVVEFENKCGFTQVEKFCCADVNCDGEDDPVMMMVRVIDNAGNHNFCMTEVTVVDFIRPEITSCPDNVVLECGTNINLNNLDAAFGTLTATDVCGVTITETTDVSGFSLDECSQGSFRRTWTVEDCSGNRPSTTCSQTISVRDTSPFSESDITWPADADITSGACTLDGIDPADLPEGSQEPIFNSSGCSNVVANFTDLVFSIVDNACQKMVRTWTVVDWCNPDQVFTFDQIIKMTNTTDPIINCNSSQLVIENTGNCSATVENLIATLSDNGACTEGAIWTYTIDVENGQDRSGSGNDASGTFPIGNHIVTFTAEDACGNTDECQRSLSVTDQIPPVPYCHTELVLPLGADATAEIWASDIDLGSADVCSNSVELSFSETAIVSSLTLDCSDVGDNPIRLFVWDGPTSNSNMAHCTVNLIIQDNIDVCDTPMSLTEVSGQIMTEQEHMIENVEVSIMSTEMNVPQVNMALEGQYAFDDMPMNTDYRISAVKNDNYLAGVSTLDLVMIQRHILGIEKLDSPYKIIAADVNNSESIDGLDLVELRKLILGIYQELPQNTSWRFVDSDYIFADVTNPFPYTENVDFYNIQNNVNDADFIGVKIGDVDASAQNGLQNNAVTNRNANYDLEVLETLTEKGSRRIQFVASKDIALAGMQMEVGFTTGDFIAIVPMRLELEDAHIAWDLLDEDRVRISWNDAEALNVSRGDILFEVLLDADGGLLLHTSEVFNETYVVDGESVTTQSIDFVHRDYSAADEFRIEQNIPNPFKDVTTIGFTLPQAEQVTFVITDVDGKQIYSEVRQGHRGYNAIDVSSDVIDGAGVLYYQIKAGANIASKTMIIIK